MVWAAVIMISRHEWTPAVTLTVAAYIYIYIYYFLSNGDSTQRGLAAWPLTVAATLVMTTLRSLRALTLTM